MADSPAHLRAGLLTLLPDGATDPMRGGVGRQGHGYPAPVAGDDMKIPKGRVRRSAKLGTAMSSSAAKYAGTKATGVARSKEGADERLEARHLETALTMVRTLGEMKGAAMKIGQLASFIDTEFLPPEYAALYQEELGKRLGPPLPMPWERVSKVIEEESGEPVHAHFSEFEPH